MKLVVPNVRHLAAFQAAARGKSISAAARASHVSQPAITQAIAEFERDMGARLMIRSARGVALSEAGRLALVRVERALAHLHEALTWLTPTGKRRDGAPLRVATSARLSAIVAVSQNLGFGSAARACGLSRTTVHHAARELERALGVTLLEATSHGVRCTREAERFVRLVYLATAEIEQARAEVRNVEGTECGETVIGVMPLARSALIPRAVLAFAARTPHHRIRLLDGPYDTLLRELQAGRADFLIGAHRDTAPSDIIQKHLFDDPLAIIVRAGHPLAAPAGRGLRLKALTRYAWIAPRPDSPLRRQFDALMARLPSAPPAEPIECNSLMAARAMLVASDRVMLLSVNQVSHEISSGQLIALPHPSGDVYRSIVMTMRRDWLPTKTQGELLRTIHQHCADYVRP